jgi:AcrR family transcriptional regulator
MKAKRGYRMDTRVEATEQTRRRVLQAAYELWLAHTYDAVSLEKVAARAGVTKQTLLRHFGSKEQLAIAVVDFQRPREEAARAADPGDVERAITKLVERYEKMGDANLRMLELERRVPAIDYLLKQSRESHRRWVEQVFEPFLPARRGASRERRVLAFYAVTEVMVWKLLRRDFRLSRKETRAVLLELVSGLTTRRTP